MTTGSGTKKIESTSGADHNSLNHNKSTLNNVTESLVLTSTHIHTNTNNKGKAYTHISSEKIKINSIHSDDTKISNKKVEGSNLKPKNTNRNNKTSLKCMYTNADCLTNKLPSLIESIEFNKPDMIVVTELKPKNSILPLSESTFNIDCFNFFSNIEENGRGIGVYTHNSLKVNEVKIISDYKEFISLKIKLYGNEYLNVVSVYRSPSSTYENNINLIKDMDKILDTQASHQLMLGDFNLKDIDWPNSTSPHNENHISTQFLRKCQDMFLYQHLTKPTRYRVDNTPSLVDLIFTNEEGMIQNISYQAPLWSKTAESDHLVIVFDFICYLESTGEQPHGLNFRKANFKKLSEVFTNIKWAECLNSEDIDINLTKFMDLYTNAVEKCIPKNKHINTKRGSKPLWMNAEGLKKV